MISRKTYVNVIYTKFKDSIPMIQELIQSMGTFTLTDYNDLSVEIASNNAGKDIQLITWEREKRSGSVRYKDSELIPFTGGTISEGPILKFNISENETLECKLTSQIDFDFFRFYDKDF